MTTEAEVNQALAEEAISSISMEDREKALADVARKRLTRDEIEFGLATAVTTNGHESEEMDRILLETAEKALMAIAEKSYSGILGHKPLGIKTSPRSKGRSKEGTSSKVK
jgi:replicative DNA helicase